MRTATQGVTFLDGGLAAIDIRLIDPGPNFRGEIDDNDLAGLVSSLTKAGQLVPLIVECTAAGRYRVREGHRRRRAALLAGIERLICVIRRPADNGTRAVEQLAMHGNAAPFDPLAEAQTLRYLMFERQPAMTREEIATLVGKTPQWVAGRLALLNLSAAEQKALSTGNLTLGQAKDVVRVRRAERDGRPCATRTTNRPARRPVQTQDSHFGAGHPLADIVATLCDHPDQPRLGGIACGPCWEGAIRADALTTQQSGTVHD